ncbi:MAG: hypothetical protein HY666_01090 [Chloroflexi bacterium]|nr:hypothetical protein [Chloroflexota bacterium]
METDELKEAIGRLKSSRHQRVDTSPGSTFEALLEQRIGDVERHVDELKSRINGLMFTVAAAIIAQLVISLVT